MFLESSTLNSILIVLIVTKAHYYITQHLHEVITEECLEYNILRSMSDPLFSQDLTRQFFIIPLAELLDEELKKLQIHLTPRYLPYWIDGIHNYFNSYIQWQNFYEITYPLRKSQTNSGIIPTLVRHIPNIFTKYLIFGNPPDKKWRPNNPCSWMWIQIVKKTNSPPLAASMLSDRPLHLQLSEIHQDKERH